MRLIAQVAAAFRRDYPQIRYHLYSGNADNVREKLDSGILDFGLLVEPVNVQKYNYIKVPFHDIWGLFLRKDSELAAHPTITAADMAHLPLLASRRGEILEGFRGWLGDVYEKLDVVVEINLINNAALMVEAGIGAAIGLKSLLNTTGDSPLCFRSFEPMLIAGQYIAWKKYQVFPEATKLFLERLQKALSNSVQNAL